MPYKLRRQTNSILAEHHPVYPRRVRPAFFHTENNKMRKYELYGAEIMPEHYRRGSERPEKQSTEEKDKPDWSRIKMVLIPFATTENSDCYVEYVEITEQMAEKELCEAIWSLSDLQQKILELVLDDWPQTKIAEQLVISATDVCKNVEIIRKRLEPYLHYQAWLKVN